MNRLYIEFALVLILLTLVNILLFGGLNRSTGSFSTSNTVSSLFSAFQQQNAPPPQVIVLPGNMRLDDLGSMYKLRDADDRDARGHSHADHHVDDSGSRRGYPDEYEDDRYARRARRRAADPSDELSVEKYMKLLEELDDAERLRKQQRQRDRVVDPDPYRRTDQRPQNQRRRAGRDDYEDDSYEPPARTPRRSPQRDEYDSSEPPRVSNSQRASRSKGADVDWDPANNRPVEERVRQQQQQLRSSSPSKRRQREVVDDVPEDVISSDEPKSSQTSENDNSAQPSTESPPPQQVEEAEDGGRDELWDSGSVEPVRRDPPPQRKVVGNEKVTYVNRNGDVEGSGRRKDNASPGAERQQKPPVQNEPAGRAAKVTRIARNGEVHEETVQRDNDEKPGQGRSSERNQYNKFMRSSDRRYSKMTSDPKAHIFTYDGDPPKGTLSTSGKHRYRKVVFISFYTDDVKAKAERLLQSCQDFRLHCEIYRWSTEDMQVDPDEFLSKESRLYLPDETALPGISRNVHSLKPLFVYRRMMQWKKNIVWLDVDMEFKRRPSLFFGPRAKTSHLMVFNSRLQSEARYSPIQFTATNATELRAVTGVMFFRFSKDTLQFVEDWAIAMTYQNNLNTADDKLLDYLYSFCGYRYILNVTALPQTYLCIRETCQKDDQLVIQHDGGKGPVRHATFCTQSYPPTDYFHHVPKACKLPSVYADTVKQGKCPDGVMSDTAQSKVPINTDIRGVEDEDDGLSEESGPSDDENDEEMEKFMGG